MTLCVGIVFCLGPHNLARAQTDLAERPSILQLFERDLQAVLGAVAPSVVTIRATKSAEKTRLGQTAASPAMSVGSGVVLDSNGCILTCSRVVDGSDDFWVEAADGRLFQAVLLGSSDEVAVLQIKSQGLKAAPFGDAVELGVGSLVAAVGNSYGYSGGVSWGEVNGFRPDGTIQLSLGVSPGSTGGALVNTRGQVVGMIKAKISEPYYIDPMQCTAGKDLGMVTVPGRRLELPTSSVSLAVPIQTALRTTERIIATGAEPRGYVGIYVEDLTGWYVAHFKTSEGVLVSSVVDNTPAKASGLLEGDVITTVDRQAVKSVRRFRQVVSQGRPGQRLMFDLIRGGQPLKLVVELGRAEAGHLSMVENDAKSRWQRQGGSSSDSPIPQTVRSSGGAVPTPASFDNRSPMPTPSGATARPAADWERRFISLQRQVDSLKMELLFLQRTLPR